MKTPSIFKIAAIALAAATLAGCQTRTRNIVHGQDTEDTAGFAQKDVDYVVNQALQSILKLDRIATPEPGTKAIIVVKDIDNDTAMLGTQADQIAIEIGQLLREGLGESGRVAIYNPEVGQYATVQVSPQYALTGRLTQRNMRLDNGDYYKEYALNLQLIELATGIEYWQKRIPFSKLVDRDRRLY